MTTTLHLLCAGAAQGLVQALQPGFEHAHCVQLLARFGAVGAMQDALRSGRECDVFLATDAMIVAMQGSGELRPETRAVLGVVRTGVAAPSGQPLPDVGSVAALTSSLLAASAVYVPDLQRSTAGLHFSGVLVQLGIRDAMDRRLRQFPNGATAMRELAARAQPGALGCTQVTEIRYTPGVVLAGVLPESCALATLYTAAIASGAQSPELARRFVEQLAGPASRTLRVQGGFETDRRGS